MRLSLEDKVEALNRALISDWGLAREIEREAQQRNIAELATIDSLLASARDADDTARRCRNAANILMRVNHIAAE